MRFFADHCVPKSVAQTLETDGHEWFRLRNHLSTNASDSEMIAEAQEFTYVRFVITNEQSECGAPKEVRLACNLRLKGMSCVL